MGVVLMWVWLAMIWAWTGGVASVLELVLKKLEPMQLSIVINLNVMPIKDQKYI